MRAIYIDTRDRCLDAYAVTVSQIAPGKLVLRAACHLPKIPDRAPIVIIDASGYESAMSGGYVDVVSLDEPTYEIVGEISLIRSLRPVSPRRAFLIKDASWMNVQTHACKNHDVAETAREVIAEIYSAEEDAVTVIEGSAITTNAIVWKGDVGAELEFSPEHQTHIVNPVSVAAAKAIDDFYMSYYGQDYETKEEKKIRLVAESIAVSLDVGSVMRLDADKKVAAHIIERYARYTEFDSILDVLSDYLPKEVIEEKNDEIFNTAHPFILVDAVHPDDSTEYTWISADAGVSAGDRVIVETYRGTAVASVVRVRRSNQPFGHRNVLEKIS